MSQPFAPPSARLVTLATAPPRRWFSPVFLNEPDVAPRRPALFVGNHTLLGVLDIPLMVEHLYRTRGVLLRSLGDHVHFRIPGWGRMLEHFGAVDGTPANCAALMRSGESVVVFPGGAREVFRRRDEKYSLIWKQRVGFARLALEHGYDLIPFASVGADEAFDVLLDADDVLGHETARAIVSRLGLLRATKGGDHFPPLVRGVGPTMLPRPQRFYFSFGPRISASGVASQSASGNLDDTSSGQLDAAWALRERAASAIRIEIDRLLAYRAADLSSWSPARRALAPVRVHPAGPGPAA